MSGIVRMRPGPVRPQLDRTHRNCGPLQYIRELYANSIEAGATRIEYTYALMKTPSGKKAYRLVVADNGCGMTPDQQNEFLNVHAWGSKEIGDEHGNFGIGFKVSALPWNKFGIVVMSWHPEHPKGSMMILRFDEETGDYGAQVEEADDGTVTTTWEPDGEFAALKPAWIKDHGTVVVLLGNTGEENTFFGSDPQADPDPYVLSSYLNKRLWVIPESTKVGVHEPKRTAAGSLVFERRIILGASWFVRSGQLHNQGGLEAHGTVLFADGTEVDWYLWKKDRPDTAVPCAHITGFIAALYKNELYDVKTLSPHYHNWGIHTAQVRKRTSLVIRPPLASAHNPGVFPDDARTMLKMKPNGTALPWVEWATEFSYKLPEELKVAEEEARPKDVEATLDAVLLSRLLATLKGRFDRDVLTKDQNGELNTGTGKPQLAIVPCPDLPPGPDDSGPGPERRHPPKLHILPTDEGLVKATKKAGRAGLPKIVFCYMRDIDGEEQQLTALWDSVNQTIRIAKDAPVLEEQIAWWKKDSPSSSSGVVESVIYEIYGTVMVSAVVHAYTYLNSKSKGFAGLTEIQLKELLLSSAALTMRMLGLFAENALIKERLRRKGVHTSKVGNVPF